MLPRAMATEIERKFLLANDGWRGAVRRRVAYRQAYLNRDGNVSVRVRIAGERANLNIKSATRTIERSEFEYQIPMADAVELLGYASGAVVEKVRHWVEFEGHTWEIDVFTGANDGLVLAEIELDRADENFSRPPWIGAEVSGDARYYNVYLAGCPFSQW